jgi:hypothetical protein
MANLPRLETAIYAKLAANTDLTAIVGTVGGLVQIYNVRPPAIATHPYVVFQIISGGPDNLTRRETLTQRVQVTCVSAASHTQAHNMADEVYQALHRQEMTLAGWSNYKCLCISQITDEDVFDQEHFYRKMLDFSIAFSDAS